MKAQYEAIQDSDHRQSFLDERRKTLDRMKEVRSRFMFPQIMLTPFSMPPFVRIGLLHKPKADTKNFRNSGLAGKKSMKSTAMVTFAADDP
jgi:hypothetical protein